MIGDPADGVEARWRERRERREIIAGRIASETDRIRKRLLTQELASIDRTIRHLCESMSGADRASRK